MSTSTLSQMQPASNPGKPRVQAAEVVVRPPFWLKTLRRNPYIYSAACKARLAYSRRVLAARQRKILQDHQELFAMSQLENTRCEELRNHGFTVLPELIPAAVIDGIFEQADGMFKDLRINMHYGYSVQNKLRLSLEGLSYEELAASEKVIALHDALVNLPECINVAFESAILRIVGNFLNFVPSHYLPTVVRDFPHNRALESSNFHKDNDEADSVQVFVYLVDIDDTRGPLVYLPGTNRYDVRSCRPRLSRDLGIAANDGRLSDSEVEKHYPQTGWRRLKVKRGSAVLIHGNGIHKGPAWPRLGDPSNQPRTAIRIDVHGPKVGTDYSAKKNRVRREDFDRLSTLQRLFAHAECV